MLNLSYISNLIVQPRFARWLTSPIKQSRFNLASVNQINIKILGDFLYQLKQSIPYNIASGEIKRASTTQEKLGFASVGIDRYIKSNINQPDIKFTVPRGRKFSDVLFGTLSLNQWREFQQSISHPNSPSPQYEFETCNLISELLKYIESRRTLEFESTHKHYESMLNELMGRGAKYFTSGYPHDVLCHDKQFFESEGEANIFVCNDYCSSYVYKDMCEVKDHAGTKFFELRA